MDLYGHLMPGNESEAAGLLDAYLTRVRGSRAMSNDHLMKVLMGRVQPIVREMHEGSMSGFPEGSHCGQHRYRKVCRRRCWAGVAEAAAQVQEALPDAHIHLHQEISEYDEWAERYKAHSFPRQSRASFALIRPDSTGLNRTEFGSAKPNSTLLSHRRAIYDIFEGTAEIQDW